MTEEQRDWQDDQEKIGNPEPQAQGAAADLPKGELERQISS